MLLIGKPSINGSFSMAMLNSQMAIVVASHSTENQAMPAILKIAGNRCLASIEIAITFMFNPV